MDKHLNQRKGSWPPALLPFSLCTKRPLGWRHHLLPIKQIQLLAVPATNNATLLATFICGQMVIASRPLQWTRTERHVRLPSFDVTLYASRSPYIYIYVLGCWIDVFVRVQKRNPTPFSSPSCSTNVAIYFSVTVPINKQASKPGSQQVALLWISHHSQPKKISA